MRIDPVRKLKQTHYRRLTTGRSVDNPHQQRASNLAELNGAAIQTKFAFDQLIALIQFSNELATRGSHSSNPCEMRWLVRELDTPFTPQVDSPDGVLATASERQIEAGLMSQ